MRLLKPVGIGLLALTGMAVAQQDLRTSSPAPQMAAVTPGTVDPATVAPRAARRGPARQQGARDELIADDGLPLPAELKPRITLRKTPTAELARPDHSTGRLLIKFKDDVRARRIGAQAAMSETRRALGPLDVILRDAGLTLEPVFTRDDDVLAAIERKAAINSQRAQPDLAGMMYVTGPGGVPLPVAKTLNQLDSIEFVEYERELVLNTMGPTGACCLPSGFCQELTSGQCATQFGDYEGDGSTCGGPTCGACCFAGNACNFGSPNLCASAAGTFVGSGSSCATDTCEFGACCSSVLGCTDVFNQQCAVSGGNFRGPGTGCSAMQCGSCCDPDDVCLTGLTLGECVAISGTFTAGVFCDVVNCDSSGTPDCGVGGTGSCFSQNPSLFCDNMDCCEDVCDLDPFCCDETADWPGRGTPRWDAWCADHANEICPGGSHTQGGPRPGSPFHNVNLPTDNFARAQGYLTIDPYFTFCSVDADCPGVQTCSTGLAGQPPAGICTNPCTVLADCPTGMECDLFGNCNIPADAAPGLRWDTSGPPPAVGSPMSPFTGEGLGLQDLWNTGQTLLQAGFGTENLSRGKGIKIGVIEFSAFLPNAIGDDAPYGHEELVANPSATQPGPNDVIWETDPLDGFTILPGTNSEGNHGTATLGIIGALNNNQAGGIRPEGEAPSASIANQRGVVGMAPDAKRYFFSIQTLGGGGSADAIARALDPSPGSPDFGPGDVLSFSFGPAACGTLASESGGDWIALTLAVDAGVTCVVAAGNECCNLDDDPQEFGDSGIIIVGAVYPGLGDNGFYSYCRTSFSNFCRACTEESAVHTSAWGTSVTTLGYGDLYTGWTGGVPSVNRTYTANFGGTSAAAPIIAGYCACLQGLAKQRWGIPLAPRQIRDVITDETGFFQCGFADTEDLPGREQIEFLPCFAFPFAAQGDFNLDGQGNRVSINETNVFTWAADDGFDVTSGEFFAGNDEIEQALVIQGHLVSGNLFSLKKIDGNYLIIESRLSLPTGGGVTQRGALGSGQTTDLGVLATGQSPVLSIAVSVTSFMSTFSGVRVVYLKNFTTNKWVPIGVDFLSLGTATAVFPAQTTAPGQFVRSGDNQVQIRVWTLSLDVNSVYQVFHDEVRLIINSNPFIQDDGGP